MNDDKWMKINKSDYDEVKEKNTTKDVSHCPKK
jgi:hypothetical protein